MSVPVAISDTGAKSLTESNPALRDSAADMRCPMLIRAAARRDADQEADRPLRILRQRPEARKHQQRRGPSAKRPFQ